jgi:hypothetical protein
MKNSIIAIAAIITLLFSANYIQANSIRTEKNEVTDSSSQLQPVYDAYFTVKDALIKSDSKLTSAKAKDLLTAITAVEMNKLKDNEHTVWMKVVKKLLMPKVFRQQQILKNNVRLLNHCLKRHTI